MEKEIQIHLQQLGDTQLAAEALLRKFENVSLSAEDYHSLATFCFQAQCFEPLCFFITRKLQDGSFTPWGIFAAALSFSNEKMSTESPLWKALIEGARAENALSHLALFPEARGLDADIAKVQDLFFERAQNLKVESKKQMFEQLDFFKSQNLLSEEEALLSKMDFLFPEDKDLKQRKMDYLNRRAELARSDKKKAREVLLPNLSDDPEVQQMKIKIFEQMKLMIQKDASLAKDFALSHLMWNSGDLASELLTSKSELESSGLAISEQWLKVESLFQSRRYVELLAELDLITQKDRSPESTFAVAYWRAQALWGLKLPREAIEILEQLLAVRPQYLSAQTLLSEWREALS